MRKIISVFLVILMLCSCAPVGEKIEFAEGITSPPAVTVQYGDISITAGKGTYSWQYDNGDGTGTAIEADSDHPLFWENISSFSAGTEETAKLVFGEGMISYELERWEVEPGYYENEDYSLFDKGEKVESENGIFEVPMDGKMYVYLLHVNYESGDCYYGFRINSPDEWGITFSVKSASATGATVVFSQSGGNPTGELMTGSYYRLEHKNEEMAFLVDDVVWTAEAYMIQKDSETQMQANWEWLYGTLEPGTYRIVKQVMDFRGPGDFDEKEYSAEFTIPEAGKEIKNLSIMKIVDGAETGELVLAGENPGDVMTLNVKDIPVFLDGEPADPSAIMDGMTVHVEHDGSILETYPARFGKVNRIDVFSIGSKNQLGGTLFDLCGLYLKVLDDIWEADSGLNAGAECVSIDLSEAPGGLTKAEKDAICWIFGNKHDVMAFNFTFEELKNEGYLTAAGGSNDLYQWDNGVLLSITNSREESETPNAFFGLRTIEFDVMKWRSPLGAYFFDDCTATWPQMGTWEDYNVGAHAIS